MRKLMVALLVGASCSVRGGSALVAQYNEPPMLRVKAMTYMYERLKIE